MSPRETENNAYAKFWGDKQRALWYVMVFSGVVNSHTGAHDRVLCVSWVSVPYVRSTRHCAYELPMGLRGRGKVS